MTPEVMAEGRAPCHLRPMTATGGTMAHSGRSVGTQLRDWRQRRRLSQLDLALDADISTRHLSYLETGRSQPSREMVLRLAERLAVPLRERNLLLSAAGYAPVFPSRPYADPDLAPARLAVEAVLAGHEPFPALAVDRGWTMVAANGAVAPLLDGVAPHLVRPPVNVLRLSLHPDGLAPRIENLPEWRAHLLTRLRHDVDATADVGLASLLEELAALPMPPGSRRPVAQPERPALVVPLRIKVGDAVLSFISTTTVFGTPLDVTLSELAIEAFYPADAATAAALRGNGP